MDRIWWAGTATAAGLWILGALRELAAYRAVRAALGRFAEQAGHLFSLWGNATNRALWAPFEALFIDFFLFMTEQFAAGMRRDDPPRLRAQIRRLEEVGSRTRARALKTKVAARKPRKPRGSTTPASEQ